MNKNAVVSNFLFFCSMALSLRFKGWLRILGAERAHRPLASAPRYHCACCPLFYTETGGGVKALKRDIPGFLQLGGGRVNIAGTLSDFNAGLVGEVTEVRGQLTVADFLVPHQVGVISGGQGIQNSLELLAAVHLWGLHGGGDGCHLLAVLAVDIAAEEILAEGIERGLLVGVLGGLSAQCPAAGSAAAQQVDLAVAVGHGKPAVVKVGGSLVDLAEHVCAGEHHGRHIVDKEGSDLCVGGGGPAVLCEAQHLGQIGDSLLVVGVREVLLALVALLDKVGVAFQHIVGVAQVIQEADVPDIAAADDQRGHIALVLDGLAESDELVPGLGDFQTVVGKVLLVVHDFCQCTDVWMESYIFFFNYRIRFSRYH